MKRHKLYKFHREVTRIALLFVIAFLIMHFAPVYALNWDIPALSPWGLFIGGVLLAGAVSHLMRRILFPALNLQSIAIIAVERGSIPAAIVFAAICAILGLLLYLNVSMLRPM
jgi:hypothetical protein